MMRLIITHYQESKNKYSSISKCLHEYETVYAVEGGCKRVIANILDFCSRVAISKDIFLHEAIDFCIENNILLENVNNRILKVEETKEKDYKTAVDDSFCVDVSSNKVFEFDEDADLVYKEVINVFVGHYKMLIEVTDSLITN